MDNAPVEKILLRCTYITLLSSFEQAIKHKHMIIITIIICKVHRVLCIAVSPFNYSNMILFLIQTNNFGFTAIKRFIEIIRLILCESSGWGKNE